MKMKKLLLLLLGLLAISLLAYFCFNSKSDGIKEDLISNTKAKYSENQIANIDVTTKGQELRQTRTLVLNGTAESQDIKEHAIALARETQGVYSIDDQIKVVTPTVVPSPYVISAAKDKDGKVKIDGYVSSKAEHDKLISKARDIFGTNNIVDNLQESAGAPTLWQESSAFGLEKLGMLEYGVFKITDQNFKLEGYITELTQKENLLKELDAGLNNAYNGSYNIESRPKPEPVVQVAPPIKTPEPLAISCQTQFQRLMTNEKIHFEYGKDNIDPSSHELLKQLISISKECPDDTIIIKGYTDSDGNGAYNKGLSQRRADAVRSYLIKNGIESEKLEAIGYGEANPIADNATNKGKEKNRRIEFNIKGAE